MLAEFYHVTFYLRVSGRKHEHQILQEGERFRERKQHRTGARFRQERYLTERGDEITILEGLRAG